MNRLIETKCAAIATYYGEEPQLRMAIEECAELTQAICKMSRDNADKVKARKHYIEELADVTIIAEQLYLLLDEDEQREFYNTLRFKLHRQIERIRNESSSKTV